MPSITVDETTSLPLHISESLTDLSTWVSLPWIRKTPFLDSILQKTFCPYDSTNRDLRDIQFDTVTDFEFFSDVFKDLTPVGVPYATCYCRRYLPVRLTRR